MTGHDRVSYVDYLLGKIPQVRIVYGRQCGPEFRYLARDVSHLLKQETFEPPPIRGAFFGH